MWGFIFNIALQIIQSFLEKKADDADAKRKFFEFVEVMSKKGLVSVALVESNEEQFAKLKAMKYGDTNKKQVIGLNAPDKATAKIAFEVSLGGYTGENLKVYAEKQHFLGMLRSPDYKVMVTMNTPGTRIITVNVDGVWLEKTIEIS